MRSAKIDFHTRTQNRPSSKVIRLLLRTYDSDGHTYLCLSMKATGEACAKWYDGRELNDGCATNISHSSFPTSLKKRGGSIVGFAPHHLKRDISIVRLIKNAIPSLVHGLFSSCVRDFKSLPLSFASTIIFHGQVR